MQSVVAFLFILCLAIVASAAFVNNVPYYRQITDFTCGPAVMQMYMHFLGEYIDQGALCDVMRCSNQTGTLSFDLVRGAQFSALSATPKQYYVQFPSVAPQAGYKLKQRDYGFQAMFHREQDNCWTSDLQKVLEMGYPVIVLQKYDEDDKSAGHYRLVVGFDNTTSEFVLYDPWDRDENKITGKILSSKAARVQRQNVTQFCNLWNLVEYGSFEPNFGLVMFPFTVSASFGAPVEEATQIYNIKKSTTDPSSINTIQLTASASFPCIPPFCGGGIGGKKPFQLISNGQFSITLPSYMNISQITNQRSFTSHNSVNAEQSWTIAVNTAAIQQGAGLGADQITVKYLSNIHGHMPKSKYDEKGTIWNPSFEYVDQLGGEATIHY